MIEVKEVNFKSKKDLKKFSKYPVQLYKNCPYYVPSLRSDELNTFNPKKNFSLANNKCKAFLCYKDGKLVGRIAGLINYKDNELRNKKMVRFSRLECIDDIEVFKALFNAVENFGRENGMEIIHGPWGFNDTDREGMLTYGYAERSTYATNYYYPYFAKTMDKLGFEPESKWSERRFTVPNKVDDRIINLSKRIKEKYQLVDIIETMSIKQIINSKYLDGFFDTLNEGYRHLDGYVPIVGDAKKNVLKQFATIAHRRYTSILVDKNDKVVAFGIVLPSIANALIKHRGKLFPIGFVDVLKSIKKPDELEMALISVRDEYKNSGINAVLINKIMGNLIEDGITKIESNPMLESNFNIQQQWKFVTNEIVKKRQTYTKKIQPK